MGPPVGCRAPWRTGREGCLEATDDHERRSRGSPETGGDHTGRLQPIATHPCRRDDDVVVTVFTTIGLLATIAYNWTWRPSPIMLT